MAEVRLLRFRHLLDTLGIPDDDFADEVDLLLGRIQLRFLTQFNDVDQTLAELRERGMFMGIVTNGAGDDHPDSQRSKAEYLGLPSRVDVFFVSDEIGHRKPDARAFLPALTAAGCSPDEILYVGDSLENDIVGANRAGMVSVLIHRSGAALPELTDQMRPRHVISSLTEVIGLVGD
jgi:putative hydrolase of the HAD superfamily